MVENDGSGIFHLRNRWRRRASRRARSEGLETISVDFDHIRIPISSEDLRKYGCPYYSVKEVGDFFRMKLTNRSYDCCAKESLKFSRAHILCANEVYPECALGDPLVDLEIWDEWQNGHRVFPHAGGYHPLGISKQEGKAASPAAIGAAAEIFAGLLAQAYVSPWVLVRPIRKWPDLICATDDRRYAFIESKGFLYKDSDKKSESGRYPAVAEFNKCFQDAVHQLNADADVKVWLSFTGLRSVRPFEFTVRFIELDLPKELRKEWDADEIPKPIEVGLVDRVVSASIAEYEEQIDRLAGFEASAEDKQESLFDSQAKAEKKKLWSETKNNLGSQVNKLLAEMETSSVDGDKLRVKLLGGAKARMQRMKPPRSELVSGRRLAEAKKRAIAGELGRLRETGYGSLYMTDLPSSARTRIRDTWQPNWKQATEVLVRNAELEMYRCGSIAVGLGDRGLDASKIVDF